MTESSESKTKTFKFHLGTGWGRTCQIRNLPELPGVYSILNREDGECLYVGQATDIQRRCSNHPVWRSAKQKFRNPGIVYKIIECKFSDLKKELLYAECLMIGLLRPEWNVAVPARSSTDILDVQVITNEEDIVQKVKKGKLRELRPNLNYGDNPEIFKSLTVTKGVLLALNLNRSEYPKGLTCAEIKAILGRANEGDSVGTILRRLADRRIIFRYSYAEDKRFKSYFLPEGWSED